MPNVAFGLSASIHVFCNGLKSGIARSHPRAFLHIGLSQVVQSLKTFEDSGAPVGVIIDAIASGDIEEVLSLMIEHLNHIEQVLDISAPWAEGEDLDSVLRASSAC